MAITTSGQISLNDINIELGRTSGTVINMNDTYVRALIGKAASTQMSLSEWYGASAVVILDTQTVTSGYAPAGQYNDAEYGYSRILANMGNITDGFSNVADNLDIMKLSWSLTSDFLTFWVNGGPRTNSGFTSMKIGSLTFNRTSALFTTDDGYTYWTWSTTTNPFPTVGADYTVTWI